MSGYGYGAGPWGGVPWGGALELELVPDVECDLFLFEHCDSMLQILVHPIIEFTGDSEQFATNYPDPPTPPTTCDLGMLSGELGTPAFSTKNAYITAVPPAGVDDNYTLELTVFQEALPVDFTDIVNHHFGFGATDATGPCAAIFVSQVGFAYAGAFHHNPAHPADGDLVLDSALQVIPGTAPSVYLGEYVTYRLAVSGVTGAVYFYATRTADIPTTGHQLIAVLSPIDASALATPPVGDRAVITARGSTGTPTRVALDRWCLSSSVVIANLLPVANAGQDQAVRLCSLAQLDGSASFDPEGALLLYHWRLINAPSTSSFAHEGTDGRTYPAVVPTGFTDRFYSESLASLHAADPIQIGDVLLQNAEPWTIVATGFDPAPLKGFYVQIAVTELPDGLSGAPFKLLRQRGITNPDTVKPSFFPDVPGFYSFDLVVFDGALYSAPSIVILNVLDSVLPYNCIPDAAFLSNYLPDFWSLVEQADVFDTFWSGLAQVTATELYALWQHEYAKSIRDIQRTIVRRWLHYDLLLEEPVPEETSVRVIWSGISSDAIDATLGNPAIDGTTLVLSSPSIPTVSVDLTGIVYAPELAAHLASELVRADTRFSVELIPEIGGTPTYYVVRIDAPFPVEVDSSSTCPVFVAGEGNGLLAGNGAAIGTDTYLVDRGLQGLDIQENDVLVVDNVGYRIVRLVDGEVGTDSFPQQRVVLKDTLPVSVGTSWSIGSLVNSKRLDFYKGLAYAGDSARFEIDVDGDDQPDELIEVTVLGVAEEVPNSLVIDAGPLSTRLAEEGTSVRLAKLIRRTYLPINNLIVGVPVLSEHIVQDDDEAIIRQNLDFFIEEYRGRNAIRFVSGVDSTDNIWEGQTPPKRLWAEYTYVDNNPVIEANFGIPADFKLDELEGLPTDLDYLSAVRGLWYSYLSGPTVFSERVGAQIFLGLPYAEEAGTIVEIREDFSPNEGRMLVQDRRDSQIIRSYRYPLGLQLEINPATGERYAVDDTVEQFAPLVEGVEVVDYIDDPEWFKGALNQGILHEVQKYHTFLVRVDSTVFDLSALLLAQRMILKIKPTWKNILFSVEIDIDVDDVDVTDQLEFEGELLLFDGPCGRMFHTLFDYPDPAPVYQPEPNNTAYGQWENQFDTELEWGFDKDYCCPEDSLSADLMETFGAPWVVKFDGTLNYDGNVESLVQFQDSGAPFTIDQTGYSVAAKTTGQVADDGDMLTCRLLIFGDGPGSDPTDYEVVIEVNSLPMASFPFDASDSFIEVGYTLPSPVSVLDGDTVTFKVRVPAGSPSPAARTPDWTAIWGSVMVEGAVWDYDATMPDGTYVNRHRPL
jgi:hypothetical protein